ncbi:MAG TPA: M15 family metallopeptidase [Steroidobacteraceae bacterium]|nr:M15 family metallopeptidase [Steroidobacteraceae bacterium]
MNESELTGRSSAHIVELEAPRCALHYEVVTSFLAMREAARADGIEIESASGFRDFDTQLAIWNRKWRGERQLLDRQGHPLDRDGLPESALVDAILCWSALPGGSRHHWGSEVDVFDRAALSDGYRLQLVPAEYAADGVFARLAAWLDDRAGDFGFFRPYRRDHGGVGPEPWHLSYAPVAIPALEGFTLSVLRRAVEGADLAGKSYVLDRLPEIYTRFVLAIDTPDP